MTQSKEARLLEVFKHALDLGEDITPDRLRRDDVDQWDSVGHMALISEIEVSFGVELAFDDVLTLDSFATALEIISGERD